jgi:hypothetical protein
MADKAGAAMNAAVELWESAAPAEHAAVVKQMCGQHAVGIWLEHKKKYFVDYDKNYRIMLNDGNRLKFCSSLRLVTSLAAFDAMMDKWRVTLKEPEIADKFTSIWRGFREWSRVECCSHGPVSAAIPSCNNAIESNNRAIKNAASHKVMPLTLLLTPGIKGSIIDYIAGRSKAQSSELSYGIMYSRHAMNRDLTNEVFRRQCARVSPITCAFKVKNYKVHGKLLLVSQHEINRIQKESNFKNGRLFTAAELKTYLRSMESRTVEGLNESWVTTALRMHDDPEGLASCMQFDLLMDWSDAFFILKPIQHALYILRTRERLIAHGFGVAQLDGLLDAAREHQGLMECNCGKFMHYGVCTHSLEDAFRKGLILTYPRTLDPKKIDRLAKQKKRKQMEDIE